MTQKQEKSSTPKNSSVLAAVQSKQQTARNTVKSTSHSNADSAVQSLNGFAGETHIFVMDAIRSKLQDSIYPEYQRTSCLSVRGRQSALLEGNTEETAMNFVSDVEFAEETGLTTKTFDFDVMSIFKQAYQPLFNPLVNLQACYFNTHIHNASNPLLAYDIFVCSVALRILQHIEC